MLKLRARAMSEKDKDDLRWAIKMRVEDVYIQRRRTWVRLHEKGGKHHEMPCHHTLEEYLHAYIDGVGIGADPKGDNRPSYKAIADHLRATSH